MKKIIILISALIVPFIVNAQYRVKNKIILPVLEVNNDSLPIKLDSILFRTHPCPDSSQRDNLKYVYFVSISEAESDGYLIDVIYVGPSEVENGFNTGIYKIGDVILIIRENSQEPLFKMTQEKYTFEYIKYLMHRGQDKYDLVEIMVPEEFCIWSLSYVNNTLNIIDLEQVKGASKYKKSDNQFPNLDFRISKE